MTGYMSGQTFTVRLSAVDADRVTRLAEVLTADPEAGGEWTVQDVLYAVARRGLDAMERAYSKGR